MLWTSNDSISFQNKTGLHQAFVKLVERLQCQAVALTERCSPKTVSLDACAAELTPSAAPLFSMSSEDADGERPGRLPVPTLESCNSGVGCL